MKQPHNPLSFLRSQLSKANVELEIRQLETSSHSKLVEDHQVRVDELKNAIAWCEHFQWRDIESAPEYKDVLVTRKKHPFPVVARKDEFDLWLKGCVPERGVAFRPTHWMPLPQPPNG